MKGWTQAHIDKLQERQQRKEILGKGKLPKVKTTKQLVKDLDDVFSIYVRRSNEDKDGIIRCCTCNRPMTFKTAQNGHFIGRQYYSLRWDETNCNPQCFVCNCINEGEKVKYAVFLETKYGVGTVDKLNQRKNNKFKLERFVLLSLIDEYEKKIELLTKHKP